jgi:hypothetical protein
MSAIPGGAVIFDILARADMKAAEDAGNRIKQIVADARRTQVVVPATIDLKRLQRDADDAKRVIREVQREAEQFGGIKGAGGLGSVSTFTGGGAGGRGGRGDSGGENASFFGMDTGTSGGTFGRAASAATILRAGVLFTTAATEIALAARDMKAAAARGDLAGQIRAESAKNAFAASMPFGIGRLGANIRELATGEQAGIDQTMFEAQQGNQKADFMARKNAEARAGEEAKKQAAKNAVEMQKQRSIDAAQKERDEGESNDRIATIRERAAAEALDAQGKHAEAERAKLIAGFEEREREMARAAGFADTTDPTKAAQIRAELAAQHGANLGRLAGFDTEQAQKEQDRRDEQDFQFEQRKQRAREEEDRREQAVQEKVRRRTISELEDSIDQAGAALGFTGAGAVTNAATTSFGKGADRQQIRELQEMKALLKQIRDKDNVAFTS